MGWTVLFSLGYLLETDYASLVSSGWMSLSSCWQFSQVYVPLDAELRVYTRA